MTIQVFGHTTSTFCLVLFHILKELGLSYEVVQLNSTEEIKSPEYLATKHPFGKIPSLNDDGFQIYETRAIARYLINKYQGTKTSTVLIPSDVQKAALVEQFISVEASYFTQPLSKLIVQLVFKKRHGKEPDLKIVNETREKLNKTLDVTTNYWEFSLADLLHIPYTFYAINIAGESELWDKRPNVSRWWKNISERECWKNIVTEYKLA
ncbi:8439_t:CDS:2 [Rhizophagus irregularis]|nr:8439_t:CDS:2 [Rhizophagus irregularis]